MRGRKVCPTPGCPAIIPRDVRACPPHLSERDSLRGSAAARGYGRQHRSARAEAAKTIIGQVCARWPLGQCIEPAGKLILPGQAWHMDHDDDDRSQYLGPSHARCNVAAGGRKSHDS